MILQLKIQKNLFWLEKETGEIKDRIIRDIRNIFKLEEENKVIKDITLEILEIFLRMNKKNYYKPTSKSK